MPPVAYQSVFQRQFQRHLGFLVEAAKLLDMQLVTTQQVFQYQGFGAAHFGPSQGLSQLLGARQDPQDGPPFRQLHFGR